MSHTRFKYFVNSVMVGSIIGLITAFYTISLATLIFADKFGQYLSHGIGLMLFGAFVIGCIVALLGPFPGQIAAPQDSTSAILAVMAVTISTSMSVDISVQEKFLTFLVTIALTSFFTGVVFMLLGRFRLGNLGRYIPDPVIGGLLAGIGWLIISGAIRLMIEVPLHFLTLPLLFDTLINWLGAVLFTALLMLILKQYNSIIRFPLMLVGAIVFFHAILLIVDISLEEALEQGWLIGSFLESNFWHLINFTDLSLVHWFVILEQVNYMITIVFTSIIMLLVNARGMELLTEKKIDINRELSANGLANIVAAFGGSGVGFTLLSETSLINQFRANNRLTGGIVALMSGIVLFNTSFLFLLPKFIVGGLLLYIGIGFLQKSLYDGFFKLSKTEYLIVLLVFFTTATIGFLEGIMVGVMVALIFIVFHLNNFTRNSR
jgi:SulP family sulfate permease